MKKTILSLFAMAGFIIGIVGSPSVYAGPGISVGVVLTDTAGNLKDSFQVGEEIIVLLSLDNMPEEGETGADQITPVGFRKRKFYLMLQFTGPDGKLITADNLTGADSPPPINVPVIINNVPAMLQGEEVEVIENGWAIKLDPFNAKDFYSLKVAGNYAVRAAVPLRTYFSSKIYRGKRIAELIDKDFEGFIASKTVPFTIEALKGDFNGDNCVDRGDYDIIMADIRGPAPHDMQFDLNQDGAVNRADARTMVGLFTNPRGAACK